MGKACNIGIFKMNIALLDKIIGQDSDAELHEEMHHNRMIAAKISVQGLKKFDYTQLLRLHRGGEG